MSNDEPVRPLPSEDLPGELSGLGPSAELVYRLLGTLEPTTTRELTEETCRPMRTVDESLRRLYKDGLVERWPAPDSPNEYLYVRREY